jgi:hypothetical protein
MSAYDKDFSDAIYGIEQDGLVTESRLKRMITMEGQLIEERLSRENIPIKCFLVMLIPATIDFAKQFKGHDG